MKGFKDHIKSTVDSYKEVERLVPVMLFDTDTMCLFSLQPAAKTELFALLDQYGGTDMVITTWRDMFAYLGEWVAEGSLSSQQVDAMIRKAKTAHKVTINDIKSLQQDQTPQRWYSVYLGFSRGFGIPLLPGEL